MPSLVAQSVKNPPEMQEASCNTVDLGLVPELKRSPGEENGSALQYSCQGYPMDGGAWCATIHGVAKIWTQLSH